MRKLARNAIKQHRDAIVEQWRAVLGRDENALAQFSQSYVDAVLSFLEHSDPDKLQLSLRDLRMTSVSDASPLRSAQALLFQFKQAVIDVLLPLRRWRTPEIVALHAVLDEILHDSLQWCLAVFEARPLDGVSAPAVEQERQRWLGELEAERKKLEDVLDGLGASALLIDRNHRILWANRVAQEKYGELSKIYGQPCHRATWDSDGVCEDCAVRTFASSKVQTGTQVRTAPDGTKVSTQVVLAPILDDHGQVAQVLEVMLDVTEAKRTEERLRVQEDLLAAVVSDCADAIITLDTEGRIQSWNAGAEHIFHYTRDEIVGTPFTVLIPQDLIDRGEYEFLQNETRLKGSVRDFETERIDKNGKRVRVSITRTALRDQQGNWIGTSAIVREITERKALEMQLAHADRLATMGTMAAGLAHEIGNPLTAISSLVQILQRRIHDTDLLERLDLVRQQVSRITTIVREMADFSRPGGHSESQAHISNVVQHAVTLARYSRSARRVDVRVDLDPNMPSVPIESDRLLQVFLNLVLNAYDAMEGEGTLRIDGKWTAPMVQVSFVDSGPGVPPALRERIFEPFFTTKPTGRGTGMGLSVSQRIVNAYGGRIALGEAATGGAVFTVSLPVPSAQGRNLLYV